MINFLRSSESFAREKPEDLLKIFIKYSKFQAVASEIRFDLQDHRNIDFRGLRPVDTLQLRNKRIDKKNK